MRIVYTGGGTMGSVSPLLAIHKKLNKSDHVTALWIGTKKGPEKKVVEKEGITFKSILSGKLRRYFSFKNITDAPLIKIGFIQSFFILLKFKPQVILSAGGFVAVPVIWAAWLLRIPTIVHQQDIRPGLANKISAPFAKRITVALEKSLKHFPEKKTVVVGNPVKDLGDISKQQASKPTVLITGGGTGASSLNELVWQSLDELTQTCNVIHITGKGKNKDIKHDSYESIEFTDNIKETYSKADVVVSRAGFSTLTELAYYKIPAIIIPMPGTHQEDNIEYFAEKHACIYLSQKGLDKIKFQKTVKELLEDKEKQHELSTNIHNIFKDYSGELLINEIKKII